MLTKLFITSGFILFSISFANSQEVVTKVLRKGEKPVIMSKPSPNKKQDYTINQFTGRWQETMRYDRKTNKPVNFTDTIFFNFTGTNDVFTQDGVSMSLKGKASVERGNELIAAADVYDIKSLTHGEVLLDDREKYIHSLSRKQKFWSETLPTNSVTAEKYTTPINVKSSDLVGNWMVYRRDADPGETAAHAYLIKALNITSAEGQKASGNVTYYYSDRTDSIPCSIGLDEGKITISTEKYSWHLNVYKANGNEFVFGTPLLMYYCKQF